VTARSSASCSAGSTTAYESYSRAALAAMTAERGDRDGTAVYVKAARSAGELAFAAGSAEAAALNTVLAAIAAEAALLARLSPVTRGDGRDG